MSAQFDHFYAQESQQFSFFRVPKILFSDPKFHALSIEAKLLYGMMLDRMELSRQNHWLDRHGRVYIYFTNEEVQKMLHCRQSKACRLMKELDQELGLIRRKKQGQGHPDRIYVMNFVSGYSGQSSEIENPDGFDGLPDSDALGKDSETQNSENGNSGPEDSDLGKSAIPDFRIPEVPESEPNKTDNNKTDFSDTESINPIHLTKTIQQAMDEIEEAKRLLRAKWGYLALRDTYPAEELDNLVSTAAEVLCSRKHTTRINGQEMPTERVVQRLLSLDCTHIDYVLECFHKAKGPIHNIQRYLLTALYYAPTTIDVYVEHLFHQHEGVRQVE